jgi:hypothetical protein
VQTHQAARSSTGSASFTFTRVTYRIGAGSGCHRLATLAWRRDPKLMRMQEAEYRVR